MISRRVALGILTLSALAAECRGQEPAAKQWVWLHKQGVWGYGYQIQDGPHRGLWRIDPETKRPPEEPAPSGDGYGFDEILNRYRASAGLHPLVHDPELSAWAAQNNVEQSARGLGHHVNPNCLQNSAWNTPDAQTTADEWIGSPPHRANLLAAGATRYGVAYGPGPFWTWNAQ